MSAYFILTQTIIDLEAFRHDYIPKVMPILEKHGGEVLVAGGTPTPVNNLNPSLSSVLSSVEIYDPATGRWSPATPLTIARFDHTATLLSSGKLLT